MMTNCPKCGKLFARRNRPICDNCFKKDEETFEKARQYLKENPASDMDTVVEETGATKKQIMRWIREGRIDMMLDGDNTLKCAKCGKVIKQGRICNSCAAKLQSGLGGINKPVTQEVKKKSNVIKVTNRK